MKEITKLAIKDYFLESGWVLTKSGSEPVFKIQHDDRCVDCVINFRAISLKAVLTYSLRQDELDEIFGKVTLGYLKECYLKPWQKSVVGDHSNGASFWSQLEDANNDARLKLQNLDLEAVKDSYVNKGPIGMVLGAQYTYLAILALRRSVKRLEEHLKNYDSGESEFLDILERRSIVFALDIATP